MTVRRALLALAVVAVVAAPVALGAAPVAAAPAAPVAPAAPRWTEGPCGPEDNAGITVVVDFQELGGGVNVRCTDGPATDGADALDQAGISWQGVVRWGRGFVCKIAGKPGNDPCIDTPPASAYWSYWVAERGGRWCYANLGVLSRTPPPGSVEGWSFSLDHQGGTSPAPRYAPPPLAPGLTPHPLGGDDCDPGGGSVVTVPPTTTPPRPGGGGGGGSTPTTRPSGIGGSAGAPDATTSTPAGGATTTSTGPGTSTTTTRPGGSTTTAGAGTGTGGDAEGDRPDGGRPRSSEGEGEGAVPLNQVDLGADGAAQTGFPLSTAVGLGLVVVLGVGGALARRRRGLAGAGTDGGPGGPDDGLGPVA